MRDAGIGGKGAEIGHELNNLLAAIQGNADLMRGDFGGVEAIREGLDEIDKAVTRARDLARKLLAEPAQEAEVVCAVLRRHTAPQKRATEPYRALRPLGIPGVAPAVAVLVSEVVRLPGVRGDDHGDTRRAELGRADDEGRKADAAVVGSELREVDA